MRKYFAGRLLLLISLGTAIPRIYLGATQPLDYDGYWTVFIAIQDQWGIFLRENQNNLHPPLFYFLLRLALWFGQSPLVYRAVSILAGVGSVFIVGRVTEKLSLWRYTPVIAALAYGLALPAIIISNEVRTYMLCVFFVLASFYYFLDTLDECSHWKPRIGFAVFAVLAMVTHYSAFFYIFACALVAGVFDTLSGRKKF